MQEYHLNFEEVGNLTFNQFTILIEELARQGQEAKGIDGNPKVKTLSTVEQRRAFVKNLHARGIGK